MKRFSLQAVSPTPRPEPSEGEPPKPPDARPRHCWLPEALAPALRRPGLEWPSPQGPEHPWACESVLESSRLCGLESWELGEHESLYEIYCEQLEI